MKLASCKSVLNTAVVYSTDRSKAVVPVLGDLFYVLSCVILFLPFSVLLALRLPRLGKRQLILVLFVRLFDLRFFFFFFFFFFFLSVSSSSWCLGKAAVLIVLLPGLFSYLFFSGKINIIRSKFCNVFVGFVGWQDSRR